MNKVMFLNFTKRSYYDFEKQIHCYQSIEDQVQEWLNNNKDYTIKNFQVIDDSNIYVVFEKELVG